MRTEGIRKGYRYWNRRMEFVREDIAAAIGPQSVDPERLKIDQKSPARYLQGDESYQAAVASRIEKLKVGTRKFTVATLAVGSIGALTTFAVGVLKVAAVSSAAGLGAIALMTPIGWGIVGVALVMGISLLCYRALVKSGVERDRKTLARDSTLLAVLETSADKEAIRNSPAYKSAMAATWTKMVSESKANLANCLEDINGGLRAVNKHVDPLLRLYKEGKISKPHFEMLQAEYGRANKAVNSVRARIRDLISGKNLNSKGTAADLRTEIRALRPHFTNLRMMIHAETGSNDPATASKANILKAALADLKQLHLATRKGLQEYLGVNALYAQFNRRFEKPTEEDGTKKEQVVWRKVKVKQQEEEKKQDDDKQRETRQVKDVYRYVRTTVPVEPVAQVPDTISPEEEHFRADVGRRLFVNDLHFQRQALNALASNELEKGGRWYELRTRLERFANSEEDLRMKLFVRDVSDRLGRSNDDALAGQFALDLQLDLTPERKEDVDHKGAEKKEDIDPENAALDEMHKMPNADLLNTDIQRSDDDDFSPTPSRIDEDADVRTAPKLRMPVAQDPKIPDIGFNNLD